MLKILIDTVGEKRDYHFTKKDGTFYVGQCLEIPQARGQGNTKTEAIKRYKKSPQNLHYRPSLKL